VSSPIENRRIQAWQAAGTRVGDVFVIDRPAADPSAGNPPLLILHGFPTCSYDYAAVLPRLAAERRVVIPDDLGMGLSAKPDVRYGVRMWADAVEATVAALQLGQVDLLTHDIGDSIGGELLGRGLDVRRRVITNGTIYMDLVALSDGQQLLLSLPDEPTDLITEAGWKAGLRASFGSDAAVDDQELDDQWQLTAIDGGHRLMPRMIRYVEDRRKEERRYTEPIETHPSPLAIVWGALDPIARVPMAHRLASLRPEARLTVFDDVGHYPMLEAPERFADAVLAGLDG
jgi:pimeloyl-ACP methyl ester carboxylesterase